MNKRKVAIIFGGNSNEHEVSLMSASNIFNAIDRGIFEPVLLGYNKQGALFYNHAYPKMEINLTANNYFDKAAACYLLGDKSPKIFSKSTHKELNSFNIAFPIIHGKFGEDGTLQGLLKSLNIPFVGSDVAASSICMDKDITKRILKNAGIPVTKSITLRKSEITSIRFTDIEEKFGLPLFIKPCNSGSSVGVCKVKDETTFNSGIKRAFQYDNKVLMEEAISAREIECAILGNDDPEASEIGEIIPASEFYSYEAKYKNKKDAELIIPAKVSKSTTHKIKATAIQAFKAVGCEGMARVDFFLLEDNSFVINEINTIPGFTNISMYPKLWEYSGISQRELITRLINLAYERFEANKILSNSI